MPIKDAGVLPEAPVAPASPLEPPIGGAAPTHIRHKVLALTVAAYMITYMDRVVISSAVPSIQKEFGFSIVTMGWILSSFQWGYALFQIPGGWLGDHFGPRRVLTWIVAWWSAFTCATTLAWGAGSMALIRFLFGMGEAGAFPTATRSLSRWMLPSERGFAQGITHAGSRLGGALTPAIVVIIIAHYGWRAAFLSFGSLGFIWSVIWFWYYRDTPSEHRSVNLEERNLIESALAGERRKCVGSVPWKRILHNPQMWIISAMYFCYAYNAGVYLVWFPKYLNAHRGFNLQQMGLYASLPLLAGTAGDALGGTISDLLAKRWGDLKAARRRIGAAGFLLSAVSIVPACLTSNPFTSVWLSCVAMFALEATVGVSWALTLDIGGSWAGSVSAVMNTCGNIGGATASALSAYLVMAYGWNAPFLVMAGLSIVATVLYLRIDATRRVFAM
jgi:MFS transporter, ACS family, glucarate transporter